MDTASKVGLILGGIGTFATVAWVLTYLGQNAGKVPVAVGVENASGTAISYAVVQIGTLVQIAGGDGEAVFPGVSMGAATLTVKAEGYQTVSEPITILSSDNSFTVTMVAG